MRLGLVMPLILIFFNTSAFADSEESTFIVEVKASGPLERTQIAELIHIDSVFHDRVFAIINQHDLKALINDYSNKIISIEGLDGRTHVDPYYAPFVGDIEFPDGDTAFHTFDEMTNVLKGIAEAHPAIAQFSSIGKTTENRDIWALRISDDTDGSANKKGIAYMGTHHAREHLSTEIPIMFAEELIQLSATDDKIRELLKKIEIFIIPMVNPDGAIHDIAGRNYKWWRKNRRPNSNGSYGVDLNRNYGYGWGTGGSSSSPNSDIYMGPSAFSEPETQAIRSFFNAHRNITIALSFHTFSELILYPWGGRSTGIGGEDERLFKKMAGDMARMNGYKPQQSSDLYIASGDTCDWLYGDLRVLCFTFELSPSSMFGGGFYPGAGIIERVFDDNLEPMLYLANLAENPRAALP